MTSARALCFIKIFNDPAEKLNNNDRPRERAIIAFLLALSLLSYARLYMLRDVYADDNCWVFAVYLGDSLRDFLNTGFIDLRRETQGTFLYFLYLPFRYLENPYLVWHSFALALQVLTPLAFYRLVRDLSADRWLAAFAATALIVVPLDHVVPYLSAINHRVGLLLGLISLYLTDAAVREDRWGWRATLALLAAAMAQHVFVE